VASESRPGALFVYGPFKLGCGLIMVAFHNVWTRTAAVVTAFGWGLVLYKGFFTSVAPQVSCEGWSGSGCRPNAPGELCWGACARLP
jgi:hypothetical protein